MESSDATNGAARTTSLRTRWNRIFAVLLLVILTGGVAVVIATGALAEGFRSTADQVQREDALARPPPGRPGPADGPAPPSAWT